MWDRGSDWSPFTCVRGGTGCLYGSKALQIGSKFALGGALWVGSKLGQKARRHSVGKSVAVPGRPNHNKNKINRVNKYVVAGIFPLMDVFFVSLPPLKNRQKWIQ